MASIDTHRVGSLKFNASFSTNAKAKSDNAFNRCVRVSASIRPLLGVQGRRPQYESKRSCVGRIEREIYQQFPPLYQRSAYDRDAQDLAIEGNVFAPR